MKRDRSKGITIFGVILLLFAVFPAGILIKAFFDPHYTVRPGAAFAYLITAFALVVLAVGILRLKNWARLVCLWIVWIWGVSIISIGFSLGPDLVSEPSDFVILGILFYAFAVFSPVTIFLTRPKVREQFRT